MSLRPATPTRPVVRLAAGCLVGWLLALPAAAPPPGVVIEPARRQPLAERASFTGRIEAIERVELRARVEGYLGRRQVEEGSEVEAGRLPFVIEKAPYEAAVAEAQANVASARANVALARQNQDRILELFERGTAAAAQRDEAAAQLQARTAEQQGREAALQIARLNLSYTEVRAPIAGRIGRAAFTEGSLVGPSSDPLATMVQQDPMYVAFPVPQRLLLEFQREQRDRDSVVVRLELSDRSIYPHAGEVRFADVAANPTTDTVTVRARVPNPDRLLYDRQLVGVIAEDKAPEQRLMVSQAALLLDQDGPYVLVVNDEDRVEVRRITPGAQQGGLLVVEDGLSEGERVIISGTQKVRPGMAVAPQLAAEGDRPASTP
jgi:membrane fusion protein (multidrug efflux system)